MYRGWQLTSIGFEWLRAIDGRINLSWPWKATKLHTFALAAEMLFGLNNLEVQYQVSRMKTSQVFQHNLLLS